jgi:ketosteroid isomerase-like protein
MEPVAVHAAVESAFNAGDVDALMRLYESDAHMVRGDASVAVGLDEIRAVWADLVALGGRVRMVTAEVARRQGDGTWRYVVDNPYGADTHAP